jgi:hypothetical protein
MEIKMKKQLLIITMLLSGYVGTSQAFIGVALLASQPQSVPRAIKQGKVYKVSKYKGKDVSFDRTGFIIVNKTKDGVHEFTGVKPGLVEMLVNGKRDRDIWVSYDNMQSIPNKAFEGEAFYVANPNGDSFEQRKDDTGRANITNKKRIGRETFVKVTPKEEGFVNIINQDTKDRKRIEIKEKTE